MDLIANLQLGFAEALTVQNILYCGLGALIGTLIGVLPGIGPIATVSLLLPLTYGMPASGALIMLAGIYYGAQYGGSTTAILLRLPGEASSVITCIDGSKMAQQGRAGPALTIAAVGSFIAGTIGTLALAAFATPMSSMALSFGPAEYFALMVFGLVASIALGSGSLLTSLPMIFLGILLGLVGTDVNSGAQRYVLGLPQLWDGLNLVAIAMGLFGVADIINDLANPERRGQVISHVGSLMPSRDDIARSWKAILRGTFLGIPLGALPGGGAVLASFAAYALEKRISASPERFGNGAVEGVAAPESANNSAAQSSFIPMLTLGLPSNALMALLIGALIIQGIQPGPQVITSHPSLFWGLIASMWIGNLMLLMINLPLVGLWVKLISVPYRFLFKIIIALSCIGVFTVSNSAFDIYVLAIFGVFGYFLIRVGVEATPLILGYILGPMLEQNAQRVLIRGGGDPLAFVQSPISIGFLLAAVALLALIMAGLKPPRE